MKKLLESTTLAIAAFSLLFTVSACGDNGGGNGGGDGDGNGGGGDTVMLCLQSCESDSDCGQNQEDWVCENGACQWDQCSSDSDCEGDQICRGGVCGDPSNTTEADCSSEDVSCTGDTTCADNGFCVCSEGDCQEGFTCAEEEI